MAWWFNPRDYIDTRRGLKKRSWAYEGAVGERTWLSDRPKEFKCVIKRQAAALFVGVTDASSEAELKAGSAGFGIHINVYGKVQVYTSTNAIAIDGLKAGKLLRNIGSRAVSEIRFALQDQQLCTSFDGEAPIDLGVSLPPRVALWAFLFAPDDEIEFASEVELPLQVFTCLSGGTTSIVCVNLGGEEVGSIGDMGPEDLGAVLAGRIHEAVPAPPDSRWKILLPSGKILENGELLLPVHELFAEVVDAWQLLSFDTKPSKRELGASAWGHWPPLFSSEAKEEESKSGNKGKTADEEESSGKGKRKGQGKGNAHLNKGKCKGKAMDKEACQPPENGIEGGESEAERRRQQAQGRGQRLGEREAQG